MSFDFSLLFESLPMSSPLAFNPDLMQYTKRSYTQCKNASLFCKLLIFEKQISSGHTIFKIWKVIYPHGSGKDIWRIRVNLKGLPAFIWMGSIGVPCF